jgi:hypothetical protein
MLSYLNLDNKQKLKICLDISREIYNELRSGNFDDAIQFLELDKVIAFLEVENVIASGTIDCNNDPEFFKQAWLEEKEEHEKTKMRVECLRSVIKSLV